MDYLAILIAAFAVYPYARTEMCEMIRVEKGDQSGSFGTCCISWQDPSDLPGRKLFGGLVGKGWINGFLADSATKRNISGNIGMGVGVGLDGSDLPDTPAPSAPVNVIQVPAPSRPPAPAPVQYPPPYYGGYGLYGRYTQQPLAQDSYGRYAFRY